MLGLASAIRNPCVQLHAAGLHLVSIRKTRGSSGGQLLAGPKQRSLDSGASSELGMRSGVRRGARASRQRRFFGRFCRGGAESRVPACEVRKYASTVRRPTVGENARNSSMHCGHSHLKHRRQCTPDPCSLLILAPLHLPLRVICRFGFICRFGLIAE